jgi:hypothetical protein
MNIVDFGMKNHGAGILDSFTRTKKRAMVNVSKAFLPGMKVTAYRIHPKPRGWEKLAELTIAEIPEDRRGFTTNELIFTEPLPKNIRTGDVLMYEQSIPPIEKLIEVCH